MKIPPAILTSILACLLLFPLHLRAGTKIDFEEVLLDAVRHSYDVRMSSVDINISRAGLQEARALYFPELNARLNSQHVQDLTRGAEQVTAVGPTIIVRNTLYQDSVSFNATYNLYDFGARGNRVLIAAKDIPLKEAVYRQSIRDTKLKVLEIYRDLLLALRELEVKQEVLPLYKDLSLTKERLFEAGLASRVEMGDEAIKVVKIVDAIDNLRSRFAEALKDLSFYTGIAYPAEGVEAADITEKDGRAGFDPTRTPEYRIYGLAMEKKKAEIEVLRKQLYYPQFGLYSNYIFYGQDRASYGGAVREVSPANFYVGLSATIVFFDGFKNNAQVERARQEMDRLRVERDKKVQELATRHEKLQEEARLRTKSILNQSEVAARTDDNVSMVSRLTRERVAQQVELLNRKIELLLQGWELRKSSILKAAAVRELQLLTEVN